MVAPLWTNFNVSGTVYYRIARDDATMIRVAGMITGINSYIIGFRPLYAVVITWDSAVTDTSIIVRK